MNAHDGWKWRLRRRRGWGKRTFSALPGSDHPTGKTGAGGAPPGCLLSRSILMAAFGTGKTVVGAREQRRGPRRAWAQPQERSLRWPLPPRGRLGGALSFRRGPEVTNCTHGCRARAPGAGEEGKARRGARGGGRAEGHPGFLARSP